MCEISLIVINNNLLLNDMDKLSFNLSFFINNVSIRFIVFMLPFYAIYLIPNFVSQCFYTPVKNGTYYGVTLTVDRHFELNFFYTLSFKNTCQSEKHQKSKINAFRTVLRLF